MERKRKHNSKLDALLAKELAIVRDTADAIPSGRSLLANFLGIRLSEVSRYFERQGRKPNGRILAGMRAFVIEYKKLDPLSNVAPALLRFARKIKRHFERSGITGPLTQEATKLIKRAAGKK